MRGATQPDPPAAVVSSWFFGRIGRPVFALLHLLFTGIAYGLLLLAIVIGLGPCPPSSPEPSLGFFLSFGALILVAILARTWIEVRRLQDIGWSGWWSPVVLVGGPALAFVPGVRESFSWIPVTVALAWFLFLALIPGSPGLNRFGLPPRSGFSLRSTRPIAAPPDFSG